MALKCGCDWLRTLGPRHAKRGGEKNRVFAGCRRTARSIRFRSKGQGTCIALARRHRRLLPMHADFGKAQWLFSMTTYAFATASRIIATYVEEGRWQCGVLDVESRTFERLPLPLEPFESIRARDGHIYFIGGAATRPSCIASVSLIDRADRVRCRPTMRLTRHGSRRQKRCLPSDSGPSTFYYPPKNPDFLRRPRIARAVGHQPRGPRRNVRCARPRLQSGQPRIRGPRRQLWRDTDTGRAIVIG